MVARVVISLDFELGWGVLERQGWAVRERKGVYRRMREDVPELVRQLQSTGVATTWAMVSHMLAENSADRAIDHLPESYQRSIEGFLETAESSTFDGRDLYEKLLPLGPLCELASHSSSHIYAEYPGLESRQYVDDIKASLSALQRICGIQPTSLVFPRDQAGFHAEVARALPGINMRLNPHFRMQRGLVRRVVDNVVGMVVRPPESRLWLGLNAAFYQTGSFNFNAIGGRGKWLRERLLRARIQHTLQWIQQADSCEQGIIHVWLHPFNLSESELNRRLFKKFLQDLSELQQDGRLIACRMCDVVSDLELQRAVPSAALLGE